MLKFRLGDGDKDEAVVPAGDAVVISANLSHRTETLHDILEFDIFIQHWLDKAAGRRTGRLRSWRLAVKDLARRHAGGRRQSRIAV